MKMLSNSIQITLRFLCFCAYALADIAIIGPDNKSVELFLDYKITYTPSIPNEGMIGLLVRASPTDACSPIAPPPGSSSNQTHWFVLADRSTPHHLRCSNRDKIQFAAQAGYKAIILYSPVDSILHTSMTFYTTTEHTNNTIPAVLVTHEDGEALQYRYLYNSGYFLLITSDLPPNLSYYLLPFAIVIGVCLLLTLSFMVIQLIRCVQERRKAQRYRLSKKHLKKLHLKKYEKGIYYETCAICLEDYIEGEKIRILPCNHAYHSKCIDPWLTKNRRVCPVCKAKVRLPGMPESSDSDSDNDNQQRSSNRDDNERTRLLPSQNHSGSHRTRGGGGGYGANRAMLESAPSTSRAPNATRFQQRPSTSRYHGPIDDTIAQPGPSMSAPSVSVITAGGSSNNASNKSHQHKKKSKKASRNVHEVVADIEPLIAPSQHSINVDEEAIAEDEIPTTTTNVIIHNSNRGRLLSATRSNRTGVDHIV